MQTKSLGSSEIGSHVFLKARDGAKIPIEKSLPVKPSHSSQKHPYSGFTATIHPFAKERVMLDWSSSSPVSRVSMPLTILKNLNKVYDI